MPWLLFLKPIIKSKFFWITLTVVALGMFTWHYGNLRENVTEAYARVNNLVVALETSNESVIRMEQELDKIDSYIQSRDSERLDIEAQFNVIRKELLSEVESNKQLQECWNVPINNPAHSPD